MDNLDKESLKQKAASWDLISELLSELEPNWIFSDENGQKSALNTISKIASERDALREQNAELVRQVTATTMSWENALAELRKAREQEPVCEIAVSLKTADLCAHLNAHGYRNLKSGDKLYSAPVPAMPIPKQEPAGAVQIGFSDALKICEIGFTNWRLKDHNKKWFRKIDGTPIPNDLLCCIAEAFSSYYETEDLMEFHAAARHEEMSIPSPRITEQDAREILISGFICHGFVNDVDYVDSWLLREGRALLSKLNETKGIQL